MANKPVNWHAVRDKQRYSIAVTFKTSECIKELIY